MLHQVAVDDAMGAMCRHEYILEQQILAATAGQPEDMPAIDDLVVATRHQKDLLVDLIPVLNSAAQQGPGAVIAATGEAPGTIEQVAAFDPFSLAPRVVGGGGARQGILAPDVFDRFGLEQRHFPVVDTGHHQHPGAGRTAAANLVQHTVEHQRAHFIAAPSFRTHDVIEAGVLELGNGFRRHHPCGFASLGALAQARDHVPGTLNQFSFGRYGVAQTDMFLENGHFRLLIPRPINRPGQSIVFI
ncbi:hypothetical protein D3C85_1026240 [compost metagenome]